MLESLGIVQVFPRTGSAACAPRVASTALRRLGGKSLLEWVVRRVTDSQRLNGVIVLLGDSPEEQRLRSLVPADVPVFAHRRSDLLSAYAAAIREYPAESIVRVCVDNPFVDPVLIDRLVVTARSQPACDYISYAAGDGRLAALSRLGIFAEWCRAKALLQADRQASDSSDRWQVTRYLYSHPEMFQLRLIPVPTPLDRDDLGLALDSEEDWEHAQAIVEALGPEVHDWQTIARLLDHQPALRKRMAVLNRAAAAN
jgi:spore coat polysaccharide biosynthesis protein SpsF (cytidylyltransferase family)